jgi:hypothetical protein
MNWNTLTTHTSHPADVNYDIHSIQDTSQNHGEDDRWDPPTPSSGVQQMAARIGSERSGAGGWTGHHIE